jgi:hypothetical protein
MPSKLGKATLHSSTTHAYHRNYVGQRRVNGLPSTRPSMETSSLQFPGINPCDTGSGEFRQVATNYMDSSARMSQYGAMEFLDWKTSGNACSDPDLFYTMRGGSGGTFAVLTFCKFQLHAAVPLNVYSFQHSSQGRGISSTSQSPLCIATSSERWPRIKRLLLRMVLQATTLFCLIA